MAEIQSLSCRLLPELEDTGSQKEMEGILPMEHLHRGYQLFKLDGGISYAVGLTNTGGGVLLHGQAHASGSTECARCLEAAAFDVQGAVEGYYILNPSEEELEQSDDEFTAVSKDGIVDLAIPIVAAIIYELPQVVLCSDDCAGLCQVCGTNKNVEPCECDKKPNPDSPFAALANADLFPSP